MWVSFQNKFGVITGHLQKFRMLAKISQPETGNTRLPGAQYFA